VRVRRALNYTIDRRRLVEIYGGPDTAQPTCQLLPPQMPGFRRYCPYSRDAGRDGRWRGPDPARARRLIALSGTKGMRVTVWDTSAPQVALDEGRYLTPLLRRLGYRARLRLFANDDRFISTTNDSRNHAQVIDAGWSADYPYPSTFIAKFRCRAFVPASPANENTSGFCDHAIDEQIRRAQSLQPTDPFRAISLWSRLDRELTDRAIWLPTVTPKGTSILAKRVRNYQYHPIWDVMLDQLWVR
jgi:peptide/nickel transport system substrate-binding protein